MPGKSRLAIDVGNVISLQDTDNSNEVKDSHALGIAEQLRASHPTIVCAKACRQLASAFGIENTFILSKCRTQIQHATVQFLSNPISDLDNQSFLQYTNISPRNVLFCTKRSGGTSSIPVKFVPLFPGNRNGPRVAVDPVGKGAVAATLGMTHMIDDREDCLLSFFWEGHLWNEYYKSVMREKKKSNKRKKKPKKQELVENVDFVVGKLIHFSSHVENPWSQRDRVLEFRNGIIVFERRENPSTLSIASERIAEGGVDFCLNRCWVVKDDWSGVCEALGLDFIE